MMKTVVGTIFLLAIAMGTFTSCGDSQEPDIQEESIPQEQAESQGTWTIEDNGLKMVMDIPDHIDETEVSSNYNTVLGRSEVFLGGDMMFSISEEERSIEDLKADLRDDQLFTYKFYDEGTQALLYQAVLPNGEEYLYQYARELEVSGKRYFIHTDQDAEYSLQRIRMLKSAINSLVSIQ
ncbi:MAG: hypothetical protein AAF193_10540 [Bacteroidota bacterium]